VSGAETALSGFGAAIGLANTAPGGAKWYLRAGATGTSTPPGGFSIADDQAYRLTIDHAGHIGMATLAPQSLLQIKSLTAIDEGATPAGAWANFGSNAYFDGAWKRVDTGKAGVNLHMNADDGAAAGQEFRFLRTETNGGTHNIAVLGQSLSFILADKVGIGTASPADRLDVAGELRILSNSNAIRFTSGWSGFPDLVTNQAEISNDTGGYQALMIVGNKSAGGNTRKVGIWDRLEVHGDQVITGRLGTAGWQPEPHQAGWGGGIHTWDVEAEGSIWTRSGVSTGPRDVAENYESDMDLEKGDVVCLDSQNQNRIVRSSAPNDSLVIGVISTEPGLLLHVNPEPDDKTVKQFPLALCGHVPCKVVDEGGPIKCGDLLTSSSTPGHAMKAQVVPSATGGGPYRPGTIIGKALGSLESGKGVIDIFVLSM
jgi:hypothetical protein